MRFSRINLNLVLASSFFCYEDGLLLPGSITAAAFAVILIGRFQDKRLGQECFQPANQQP